MEVQATSGQTTSTAEQPQSTHRPPQRSRPHNRPQSNSTEQPNASQAQSNDEKRKKPSRPRQPQNKPQVDPNRPRETSEKGGKGRGGGGKGRYPPKHEKDKDGKDRAEDRVVRETPGHNTPEDPSQPRASPIPGARHRKTRFNASLTTEAPQASGSQASGRRRYGRNRPALPGPDKDDLTSNLIRGLTNQPYADCPICFNAIHPPQPIWCCSPLIPVMSDDDKADHQPQYCWTPFHLKCIRSWSETSYNDVKAAWAARGEPGRSGEWRCPGCQGRRNRLISGYSCFCGSTRNPNNRLVTPHSCGNPCSRQRTSCQHPCPLLCHPGPCPPCKVTMDIPCNCNRKRIVAVRCGDDAHISCNEPCSKILNCGKHHCTKTCHIGDCDPCPEKDKQRCWCGKEEKEVNCGEGDIWLGRIGCDITSTETMVEPRKAFGCTHICGKSYDCGQHACDKPCHPPSDSSVEKRGHCPLSPDRIRTCPCGKRRIGSTTLISASASTTTFTQIGEDFPPRTKCTDPIPTCSSPCLKPQLYCDHLCQTKCHTGSCPPCSVDIVRPCRCGSTTQTIKCGALHQSHPSPTPTSETQARAEAEAALKQEVLCEKPCLALRSCGRHQCNRVCCPLASFGLATMKKGKKKATMTVAEEDPGGLHECDLICGKTLGCGNHTCEERDHKGPCKPCLRSSFEELICFCGQTVLEPPIACGTKVRCPYPCVFPPPSCGHPKTPHTCHADDIPCPPCYALTTKTCACGKKEVPNVRCSLEREKVGCGSVCGKLLGCGFHRCDRICHADDCGACTSMCGKLRKLCLPDQHPCTHLCHAPAVCPEDEPCQSLVSLSCPCGRIRQSVLCGKSTFNPTGSSKSKSQQEPKCTAECAVAKRNRKLAEALGINTQNNNNKGAGGGEVVYHDELVGFARMNGKFLGVVEKAFADFVKSSKKSQVLPHMPPERRKFVHDLANVYRMDTQMIDQEPQRSVQIIRRIDTRIPTPTLSAYLTSLAPSSTSSPSSLGKLVDLRKGASVPSAPAAANPTSSWRSGNLANVTGSKTTTSTSSAPTNRGWTSVVGGTSTSNAGTSTGSGAASPWNISRAASPQMSAQTRGSAVAAVSSAVAHRASETLVVPAPSGSSKPVPDSWEDEA